MTGGLTIPAGDCKANASDRGPKNDTSILINLTGYTDNVYFSHSFQFVKSLIFHS